MIKKSVTYWLDGKFYLGYLNDYPEYMTQGISLDELLENLKDIYHDIEKEEIPGKRYTIDLEIV